jgi:hypothetical protein
LLRRDVRLRRSGARRETPGNYPALCLGESTFAGSSDPTRPCERRPLGGRACRFAEETTGSLAVNALVDLNEAEMAQTNFVAGVG